jgi:D-alanine-D-alanine ligase
MAGSGWTEPPSVLLLHHLDPDWLPPEKTAVLAEIETLVAGLRADGLAVEPRLVETSHLGDALSGVDPAGVVVLNMCEALPGVPRSEALVTSELDARGFTYTGSPTCVLELSWDKAVSKRRLFQTGVATPEWRTFHTRDVAGWDRFPAIVKPAHEHASVGLTDAAVVFDREALARRVAFVLDELAQPAIVEQFIDGREFHVTVWGNGRLRVLPPAEMDFSRLDRSADRLCTFDAKFTPGSRHWDGIDVVLPAELEPHEVIALERAAIGAYRALGCRDYARIDVRLGGEVFWVLDVNPNCDLSTETTTALAAELALGSFAALLGRIIGLAAARHEPAAVRRPVPSLALC